MNPKVQAMIEYAYQRPLLKTWLGDDPKPAFDNGPFDADNWNDARINILRSLLRASGAENGPVEFDWDGENARLLRCWCEDQTYYFVRVHTGEGPGRLYHIEWYKDRGRTEIANVDGHPMTEKEAHDLALHLGEAFGNALLKGMEMSER